jgi:mono/diheme cytochrome c family protein
LVLPAATAAVAVMAACGAQSSDSAPVAQNGVATPLTGSDVYQMSCARCHGASREGKTDAPKLDVVRMASLGDQPLRFTIQYGKGRMRGFGGLSQTQVDVLVAYLRGE